MRPGTGRIAGAYDYQSISAKANPLGGLLIERRRITKEFGAEGRKVWLTDADTSQSDSGWARGHSGASGAEESSFPPLKAKLLELTAAVSPQRRTGIEAFADGPDTPATSADFCKLFFVDYFLYTP